MISEPSDYERKQEIDRLKFFWRIAFHDRRDEYPVVEDWTPLDDQIRRTSASFTIDGQRFAVEWKHERYGSDRADWDDGWWPDFYAIVSKRRGLIPWRRRTRIQIYWESGDRTLASQLAAL